MEPFISINSSLQLRALIPRGSSWSLSIGGGHRAQAGHSRVGDTVSSSTQGPPDWLPFFVSDCDGSQAGVGALPWGTLRFLQWTGSLPGLSPETYIRFRTTQRTLPHYFLGIASSPAAGLGAGGSLGSLNQPPGLPRYSRPKDHFITQHTAAFEGTRTASDTSTSQAKLTVRPKTP
jgi:hypothetical protein